jgi:hypothetical protein
MNSTHNTNLKSLNKKNNKFKKNKMAIIKIILSKITKKMKNKMKNKIF